MSRARSILLVEDEPLLRMDLADELRRSGFAVVEASSAGDAIRALGVFEIDLACTDLETLGDLDGMGLLRWLTEFRPSLPVAIVSGSPRSLNVAGELCDKYILFRKPIDQDRVGQAVLRMFGGSATDSDSHVA